VKRWIAVALGALLLLGGSGYYLGSARGPDLPKLRSSLQRSKIKVGALERTHAYYVPPDLPPGAPLVFVFHGSQQTGELMREATGYELDRLADQYQFAVIYPDGYEHHWNDCRRAASYSARALNIDDKGFVLALIEELRTKYRTGPVFAVGYSNGGHFAYRLALELPDHISGIAAIAANLPTPDNSVCEESKLPIAALVINGTDDPINPYRGGKVSLFGIGDRGTVLSAEATTKYFIELSGLIDSPTISKLPHHTESGETSVEVSRWGGGQEPEVELVTVHGGGHVVFGTSYRAPRALGKNTLDLNAPEEIWSFFSRETARLRRQAAE
jgi:polyhydroxybutyrate depolymerase